MIFSDIIEFIQDIGEAEKKPLELVSKKHATISARNSIKRRSKDLILQYPMLISDSISMDSAMMITKALEHEYVNMLNIILNSEIISEINGTNNDVGEYLKKYHTNLYRDVSNVFGEAVTVKEIEKANKELLVPYEETLNSSILNEMSYPLSILDEAEIKITTGEKKKEKEEENDDNKKEPKRVGQKLSTEIRKGEFKKMNDMSPTIVKTTLKIKASDDVVYDKEIIFGVKGVMHPLRSEDVVYYLSDSVKDTNKLFRFIQWTTGEIKFFKDFVLSMDVAKKMAIDASKGDTFWWRKLKSLSKSNKLRQKFNFLRSSSVKTPVATSTMIISKQDVDRIKNKHGIDLLNNTKAAFTIVDKYFLLGFVIMDESTEMVYIYNDISHDYDIYTFNSIRSFGKDTTSDGNITKTLMKG